MKREFLTVHDYGTGGVWAVFTARTAEEIVAAYPELKVIDRRPSWMTDDHYRMIASNLTLDIDEAPTGWLATLVAGRTVT